MSGNESLDNCADHADQIKAINELNTNVTLSRADNRWWLRIGGGLFTLCCVVATLLFPAITRVSDKLAAQNDRTTKIEERLKTLETTIDRIVKQRNVDHSRKDPLM